MRGSFRRISTFGVALLGSIAAVELAGIRTAEAVSWNLYGPSGLNKVEVPSLAGVPSGSTVSPITFIVTVLPTLPFTTLVTFLSTTKSGSNYAVYQYDSKTNTSSAWSPAADFVALSQDAGYKSPGYQWGIGAANRLWQDEGGSTFTNSWGGATSVASNNPTAAGTSSGWLLATNDGSTQNNSGKPHGQTIYCYVAGSPTWTSGTWTATRYGAGQVVADADSTTNLAYALGSSGDVWSVQPAGSGGINQCSSGTVSLYQIASLDGVYGMDSVGTVWQYVASSSCWQTVASQTFTAASISTENDSFYGSTLVWAEDTGGNLWYAD